MQGIRSTSAEMDTQVSITIPPFSLVGQVLQKVQENRVTLILITQTSQSWPWSPELLNMSMNNPICY